MEHQREMNMKRSFFGRRRVRILLTLGVLLLAAAVVIGWAASFTSTTTNADNIFTAGDLTHQNDGTILNLTGLKPDGEWVITGSAGLENPGKVCQTVAASAR